MAYSTNIVIPRNKHNEVMSAFWSMMMALETQADNENDRLTKHFVEGYFNQWNKLCDDNKEPIWIRRTKTV